ncbi:olfactory receptor 5A2-like [Sphaerodactylus townsendi]|uniref:olfactory receptor 5A2-like n=1 Tax=Sphaerodactylus townsendi TaxID=933632 RepID=UPI002026A6A0|nr:olfactory receptor 5A2-like [Sphaerodactylus townsendi]
MLGNQTDKGFFSLLGLTNNLWLQIFIFVLFLIIYLLTIVGNVMIMLAVKFNPNLQNPMYFFLSHLSFLDVCYSSVTLPKMLEITIVKQKTITVSGCFIQAFFILFSATTEVFMLSSMAYDRYCAICKPLNYMNIMNMAFNCKLVATSWTIGFLYALANTLSLFRLEFCGSNIIRHFSCELPSILSLSCSDTFMNKMLFLISGGTVGIVSLFLTVISYIHIISTILRITTTEGRQKAFSTCSSHLVVVTLFYGTGYFRYLRPSSASSMVLDEILSIQYSILTPLLNPVIYSLPNKEMKASFKKVFQR